LPLGTDGCGIPVYATSLRRAARSFALATHAADVADRAEPGVADSADVAALHEVVAAMAAWPAYVAGTGRFDTVLGTATAGRIVGKAGAEGVHGAFLLRERLGLVLKTIDGATRAAPVAALGLLAALGALEPAERAALASFSEPQLRNVAGRNVGRLAVRPDTIRSVGASVGVPSLQKD
jgi:L-asparaginase II